MLPLSELKSLYENYGEVWAFDMAQLLCKLNQNNATIALGDCKDYDHIVDEGIAYHESLSPLSGRKRRDGHNLALWLQKFKTETLRFETETNTPFTNNVAEQAIRMMKSKQKVSGGFRTIQGAQDFCVIQGFLSTCRKTTSIFFRLS